ncbi:hypothetical protein [Saccharophagus degradans]|uniref:hypothetical protein n=1 Tax=Saccharophagus degradans TaxID=86304 RepID=UPI0026E15453|nr:hypothetical protein [Saccharophagus degradans]
MALVLSKKNNDADGRFGHALWGFQAFSSSSLFYFDRQPVCLNKMPRGQKCLKAKKRLGLIRGSLVIALLDIVGLRAVVSGTVLKIYDKAILYAAF